ncbi:MAG: V-type ATP synthase subunit D [Deltaproteobacteria bacterium]|nr:V-type ATP synthase subunit D [Deltaproteobacteria bacterium]
MPDTSPTRMNLIAWRSQLGLAVRGTELLEKKRDALVQEFLTNAHEAIEIRKQLYKAAREAHRTIVLARSFDGPENVETLSLGMPVRFDAQTEMENVWGIKVPRLLVSFSKEPVMSPLGVGGRTIAAQAAFQNLCTVLVRVANSEARLRRIAEEIKKTARRVNALQQVVIPGTRGQIRFIQQALDQLEQEDIFRLKRIKGKLEARDAAKSGG